MRGCWNRKGLAQADVRDSTVTLPAGVELSPSAANGLVGCPEGPQVALKGSGSRGSRNSTMTKRRRKRRRSPSRSGSWKKKSEAGAAPSCPDASKLGTVEVKTPLLPNKLKGYVYLAEPAPNGEGGKNPFGSLVALYMVARDPVSGVLVKLAGEGQLDEQTLRVATTFRDTPQVPFRDLQIDLFGGPRASVSTPARCGAFASEGVFTPWSGTGPVGVSSPFEVSSGVGGGACPGAGCCRSARGSARSARTPRRARSRASSSN